MFTVSSNTGTLVFKLAWTAGRFAADISVEEHGAEEEAPPLPPAPVSINDSSWAWDEEEFSFLIFHL